MIPPPLPDNEKERLEALIAYEILDTPPEPAWDDLVALVAEACEAPIALAGLVDRERQWFKAAVGLEGRHLPREVAFGAHLLHGDEVLVVPDATADERFASNPLVTGAPGVRFYAGVCLRGRGYRLGTLCIYDRAPRPLSERQRRALLRLRRQAEALIELQLRSIELRDREERLRVEHDSMLRLQRKRAELARLLARDMNDPLAVILSNSRYLVQLEKIPSDWRAIVRDLVEAGNQMESMARDVLDVGASEEGSLLLRLDRFDLEQLLLETTSAVATASQGKQQTLSVSFNCPEREIRADRELLRRTLENLVTRALRSTPPGGKIEVEGVMLDGEFAIRVRDGGPNLPPAARERIFDQYARLDQARFGYFEFDRGMGMTFCKVVVEAHGGRIWVEENEPFGNVFCVQLPANPEAAAHAGPRAAANG